MSPPQSLQNPNELNEVAPALLLYARSLGTSGPRDAHDLVQEAIVRILAAEQHPLDARAWLFRTVRNLAFSAARREHVERRCADHHVFRDDRLGSLDTERLAAAIGALDPQAREIVVLKVWAELTFDQIASVVSVPAPTAHRRFREALLLLREKMDPSCNKATTKTTT